MKNFILAIWGILSIYSICFIIAGIIIEDISMIKFALLFLLLSGSTFYVLIKSK
jgi:hypothetical protein